MDKNYYLAILIEGLMRQKNVKNPLPNMDDVQVLDVLGNIGGEGEFDWLKIKALVSDSTFLEQKDLSGINPLINTADRIRLELGASFISEEEDIDAKYIVNEYYEAEAKLKEVREKLSKILNEEKYRSHFDELNKVGESACDLLVRVYRSFGSSNLGGEL